MSEQYAMYLRKSRADAEAEARGEGETLARHKNTLMELAKRQHLDIVKIYKEIVSGDSISARPQMQLLLADISEKKYKGVIVMEIERLARGNTIDQGIVAQAFKDSGTMIITPLKTYDPLNEFDEEYFEFSLFMSRREYKTINRRMQAGRLSAVKEGNYISSGTPYGYRKVSPEPQIHTLEIVPEEAEVIKEIYKLYLEGKGPRAIASILNNSGIKPQKSQYWEKPTIKKILENPVYCGKLTWKSEVYDGMHEKIISDETFQAVQHKRKHNPIAQTHSNDILLNYYNGILYCGNCGHQLKRRALNGKEHMLCRYRECRGKTVSASMQSIDEAIVSSFRYRIQKLENMLTSQESPKSEPKPDLRKPLKAELEKAKKQKNKLYELLEQEIYDTETFVERLKIVSAREKELERQLAEITDTEEHEEIPPEQAITNLMYVVDNFLAASSDEKRKMLKNTVRKIYYFKSERMYRNRKGTSDLRLEIDFL